MLSSKENEKTKLKNDISNKFINSSSVDLILENY